MSAPSVWRTKSSADLAKQKNLNIEQHYQSTKQAAQLDICSNIMEKLLKGKCNKLFSNYLNVLR